MKFESGDRIVTIHGERGIVVDNKEYPHNISDGSYCIVTDGNTYHQIYERGSLEYDKEFYREKVLNRLLNNV